MKEALKLALEAGFRVGPSREGPDDVWGVGANLERFAKLVAEKAIKEALAQPEQEPTLHIDGLDKWLDASLKDRKQRTWVGLTEEEVDEIYTSVQEEVNKHWDKGGTTMMFPFTLYKAIEHTLKERNT